MAAPAITIWGADTTRSDLLRFACAEVGVPYEFKALDWAGGEHKGAAYLVRHAARCSSRACTRRGRR
jgi:hypothetical protein